MANLENTLKWLFLLFALIYIRRKEITIARKIIDINDFIKKIPFWIKKSWTDKRLRRFWIIFLINMVIKSLIDLWLTPHLMITVGYKSSLLYTTFIYLFIGITSLWIYDYFKTDVFWLESLKKDQLSSTKIKNKNKNHLINFILKNNTAKSLLELLLYFKNPAFWVVYSRDGNHLYNGFAGKNIKLHFTYYLLIMNIYWNTMVYLGLSLWKIIWKLILVIF